MNTKYLTHITKQDEEPPIACMTFHSNLFLGKTSMTLAPTKAQFTLHEPIPITPLFGITGLNLCLF